MTSTELHATSASATMIRTQASPRRVKRTYTYNLAAGPVVVDYWEPDLPSGECPILLVHGWGGTGRYWKIVARALSLTTPVIVPDLPGTGRSQPLKGINNLYDQVQTLCYLLDQLNVERVQLVGHSMGGAMSVLLAAQQPQRVSRLVLTSLTFFMTERQKDIYREVMRFMRFSLSFRPEWLVSVPGMAQLMAKHYFYRIPRDRTLLRQGLLDYLQLDKATALACAENATDDTIKMAGYRVQAPTLLIAARQDEMMPLENVDFTANIIPDCEVRWIEECGHLPMVEKPEQYLAILRSFLHV